MNTAVRATARLALAALAGTVMLSGCGSQDKAPAPADSDPAVSGALANRIMTDPEMAGQEGAALAADGGQVSLPPEDRSPEALADARARAQAMARGTLRPAPPAAPGKGAALAEGAATAAQVARESRIARTDCAARVQYSNTWAARLPDELPVYPRGAVQEAAGVDSADCALRTVNFVTPVPADDVISFYYTMAGRAGYGAAHESDGQSHALGGRKGGKAYVVFVRQQAGGLTEVDLVTSGK